MTILWQLAGCWRDEIIAFVSADLSIGGRRIGHRRNVLIDCESALLLVAYSMLCEKLCWLAKLSNTFGKETTNTSYSRILQSPLRDV